MSIRLNKAIKEFGVGLQTLTDFLNKQGDPVSGDPNQKLNERQYELLTQEFGADKDLRNKAEEMLQSRQEKKRPAPAPKAEPEMVETVVPEELRPKIKEMGRIDLDAERASKAVEAEVKDDEAAPQQERPAAEAAPAPAPVTAPQAERTSPTCR